MPAFLTAKEYTASADEMIDDQRYSVPMYNEDGLVIRISPNNYHILYDPYTSDWWVQSTGVRKRGLGAYLEVKEHRKKGIEAMFETKERNEWMKGADDAKIAGKKAIFTQWIRDGPTALEGGGPGLPPATTLDTNADAVMGGI